MLHYHIDFKVDYEVKCGLYECLERLVGDLDVMGKIDLQLEFQDQVWIVWYSISSAWTQDQNSITMVGIIW